jgi:hypothetical protein
VQIDFAIKPEDAVGSLRSRCHALDC